jgi:hypothetical protein
MADKLKITTLEEPDNELIPFYDDWYIDLTRIGRLQVAIFMHVRTRLALAMPIHAIGGMRNLFGCFPVLFRDFLLELDPDRFDILDEPLFRLFDQPSPMIRYCRTNNKSVASHVRQFQDVLLQSSQRLGVVDQITCDDAMRFWSGTPIKDPENSESYSRPAELFARLLSRYGKEM